MRSSKASHANLGAVVINSSTGLSNIYGYTVMIGIGTGSFLTAGLSIAQNMVDASDMTNVVGFITVGK